MNFFFDALLFESSGLIQLSVSSFSTVFFPSCKSRFTKEKKPKKQFSKA
jgi:hypothetical protein